MTFTVTVTITITITIWYPPKDLPNSMLLETLLATFAPIVHEADLWRGNLPCIIRIIFESFLIQESALNHPNDFGIIFDSGPDPKSKIQDSWEVFPRNLGSSTCLNHPNHFGPDPRSNIQDVWEVFSVNLGSSTCPNHTNHFGIIFDSGAGIQDPRCLGGLLSESWILDLGSQPESRMIPK